MGGGVTNTRFGVGAGASASADPLGGGVTSTRDGVGSLRTNNLVRLSLAGGNNPMGRVSLGGGVTSTALHNKKMNQLNSGIALFCK